MTNHPRRQRDVTGEAEQDLETAEALARELGAGEQELRPAAPGDIPPQGSAEVPAHTGNGVPPGLRPNAAKQIGDAAGAAMAGQLGAMLPQMLFDAFATVLSQVPVQAVTKQHLCGPCLRRRIVWEQSHQAAMTKAIADACEASGITPADPRAGQLDITAFLPPDLRPGQRLGMPEVREAITTVDGTDVCAMDVPGAQGRAPLLVVSGAMSPALLGQFAGTG